MAVLGPPIRKLKVHLSVFQGKARKRTAVNWPGSVRAESKGREWNMPVVSLDTAATKRSPAKSGHRYTANFN